MWGTIRYIKNVERSTWLYLGFFIGCAIIYKTLQAQATGIYDYLLTLSAAIQTLAFALLVIETAGSPSEGLSEKTLWTFLGAHITRLSTTSWGSGYVPEDNTSDAYLYQTLEFLGVLLLIYQILKLNTLRSMHDVGQNAERWSIVFVIGVLCVVLAYYTKSTGHGDYYADLSWMFSCWFEAFALCPQVYLLLHGQSQVDATAAHFAGLTLLASLVFGVFWSYTGMQQKTVANNQFFNAIYTCAFIRLVMCATYVFLFVKFTRGWKGGREYEMCSQTDEL